MATVSRCGPYNRTISSASTARSHTFRASELAQIPMSIVRDDLKVTFLALSFGTSCLATESDKNQSQSSYLLGRKALWTKELEVALKEDATDMLVHDPIGRLRNRGNVGESPVDSLVAKAGLPDKTLEKLPEGSVGGSLQGHVMTINLSAHMTPMHVKIAKHPA
ncbi:hypothetical protein P692DRAFT_20816485 [Suillus brevipes Sb2]|nr:hypothetical protein P692DRAFT_20816485 [Suillus brevipes Sb2]